MLLINFLRCIVLQAEPGEETTSSQGEWEDYNETLTEVLTWLEKAETQLKSQAKISNDVDVVKDQFHEHEVRLSRVGLGLGIR